MRPTITAFENAPDEGEGQARDMRVRWAFEEVGQAYDVRLVSMAALNAPAHRALQPFGQIPTYEAGDLTLFESGAIVLHIAETHAGLLPPARAPRARAIAWMFAALNTIEPPIVEREAASYLEGEKPWYAERTKRLEERIVARLRELAQRLGDAPWLDGDFGAGDLMMVTVLRRLEGEDTEPLLHAEPRLAAYVARGEARPAFQRAFAAQRAVFEAARAKAH